MRLCVRRQQGPSRFYIPVGKYYDAGNGYLDAHEIVTITWLSLRLVEALHIDEESVMKFLISIIFALLFVTFSVQYFSNGSASAAMEEGTALVAIKTPESYSQNAQIGQRLFEAKCADCHGSNAVGQAGVAPPLSI